MFEYHFIVLVEQKGLELKVANQMLTNEQMCGLIQVFDGYDMSRHL